MVFFAVMISCAQDPPNPAVKEGLKSPCHTLETIASHPANTV